MAPVGLTGPNCVTQKGEETGGAPTHTSRWRPTVNQQPITITNAADLLNVLPALLGFHPTESLCPRLGAGRRWW